MTRPPTSYSFTRARSRPTFQNMMTPASKTDVSETDVSPKKMKIQKKPHGYLTQSDKIVRRVAVMPCRPVSAFRSDG